MAQVIPTVRGKDTILKMSELFTKKPQGVIGIDGELGAGKTQLSVQLSNEYKIPLVHVDDFLITGRNEYVKAIKINELSEAISDQRPIIVEGICLLSVLKLIGISPDIHIFLYRSESTPYKKGNALVSEVQTYIQDTKADKKATKALFMNNPPTNQLDVDIAYLKAKTTVSIMLSIGGIVSLIVGAFILGSGINSTDSAVFEVLGAKLTAEGIGAVILGSSVFWAYFAYLSRPKYSKRKEMKSSVSPNGTVEEYEFESSTMFPAQPRRNHEDL